MSQLNTTSFKNLYGASGTVFPDNTTQEISEGDMRTFGENVADSYLNITDHFIDEDSFASDSATKVPSQQSVKAFVAAQVAGSGSSGTWTPTLTNVANIDSSSAPNLGMYFRMGNVVSCAVWVTVDPTTIGVTTSLGVSLPIASNFANASEAVGSGSTGEREAITVIGDPTNNRVQAGWTPSVNVTSQILIQFMYRVI